MLLTGCFYLDPIVKRPGAYIVLDPSTATREATVTAQAMFDEPARHGTFSWGAFACARRDPDAAASAMVCDTTEFYTGASDVAAFTVPVQTIDGRLVSQILVKLEARDDRGSLATAEERVAIGDGAPTVELSVSARALAAGAPIDLFARYSDPEILYVSTDIDQAITWEVSPSAPLTKLVVPPPVLPDPLRLSTGRRLVVEEPGAYVVTVTAHDPAGNASMPVQRQIDVAPDRPPCLAQWQPIAPPDGRRLPVGDPTVFQIALVDDDLDAFPPVTDAPQFGITRFEWSILPPGGAPRETVRDAVGNRFVFDPSAYTPGDVVELRVEIFDRHSPRPPCDDAAPTCAIPPTASCLQRQTWRLEVR